MEDLCKIGQEKLLKDFAARRTFLGVEVTLSSWPTGVRLFHCARNLEKYLSNFEVIFGF